jgi:hypothetical protein
MEGAKLLFDLIVGLITGYRAQREELFSKHVEPVQQQITEVHRDYQKGFAEVRKHLADRSRPPAAVLEFLKERRREYESQRDLLEKLSSELASIRRIGVNDTVRAHIEAYCNAILRYLAAACDIGGVSWYSDFIRMVEGRVRLDVDNVWSVGGINGNPRGDLLRRVDEILERDLPEAFSPVNTYYAVLRTSLI